MEHPDISSGTDTVGPTTDDVPLYALETPLLNFDTMWLVMTFLPRPHVFSVMKTCRALYSLGIPLLFRPSVTIYSIQMLKAFSNFVLRNSQRSSNLFRHFRILDLSFSVENNSSEVLMLAEILSHSTQLEKLRFHSEIQQGRNGRSDELTTALTHLSQLRSLSVNDATDTTLDWMKELDAPLSKVAVFFGTRGIHEPLPALLRFSSTLTKLRMDFVSFLTGPTSSFCFPHVHTLKVGFFEITPAVVIFRIFPNLKHLDVKMHFDGSNDPPNDNVVRQEHTTNKDALERAFRPLPSLDYLKGEPTDLYRSALICPAQQWHIHEYDGFSIQWLSHVLHHISPLFLDLFIDIDAFEEDPVTVLESLSEKSPYPRH